MINNSNKQNIKYIKLQQINKLKIENEYYNDELYWIKEHIKTNKAIIDLLEKET